MRAWRSSRRENGIDFNDHTITDLATQLYNRVDWPWMLNGGKTFSMGWYPETGFLATRWDHYSELMMLYLLAILFLLRFF